MQKAVEKFIKENDLLGKTILVGLSGGVDSCVLTFILSKVKDINLKVIHLNHNWRMEESKRDEEFAFNFAKKLGLSFYSETLSSENKKNETTARELRYQFFEKMKNELKADAVFLAHNKNDNVETLIYRLIKGTGPKGLNSILKNRDFYYRPLIDFERYEIEKFAIENDIDFVVDSSNFDNKYKRNLIRNEILPLMAQINPEVINSISTFIEVNKKTQEIVDKKIEEVFLSIKKDDKILRDKFLKLDEALKLEILNRELTGVLKNRDNKTIKKLLKFIEKNESSKTSISANKFLKIYDNKIYVVGKNEKKDYELDLKLGENKFLNYSIIVEEIETPNKFLENNSVVQFVNLDFKNNYKIRTRQEGDKIQPFGQDKLQKLKTFLIKKKIPSELRNNIPLIALEDEVLYLPKIIISEKLRVEKNQKNCYKITIKEG